MKKTAHWPSAHRSCLQLLVMLPAVAKKLTYLLQLKVGTANGATWAVYFIQMSRVKTKTEPMKSLQSIIEKTKIGQEKEAVDGLLIRNLAKWFCCRTSRVELLRGRRRFRPTRPGRGRSKSSRCRSKNLAGNLEFLPISGATRWPCASSRWRTSRAALTMASWHPNIKTFLLVLTVPDILIIKPSPASISFIFGLCKQTMPFLSQNIVKNIHL